MRGLPPLPGRRQRWLLQADPQSGVRKPPPGMPQLRPLCPPGSAQRRHIRPGAEWTPRGLNPDEPQLLCRTRKRKSQCGPSTNGIPVGRESRNPYVDRVPTASTITQFPGFVQRFLPMAPSFLCSTPGFLCRLSFENRFDPLYTCEGITLIFFPFSGSRHPPFVFVDY